MNTDEIKYGQSTTRDELPDEVFRRVMRRADADQNKHINLARIADTLDGFRGMDLSLIGHSLGRIADALDRAFPDENTSEPDIQLIDGKLPVPGDVDLSEGGEDYNDTTPEDWRQE